MADCSTHVLNVGFFLDIFELIQNENCIPTCITIKINYVGNVLYTRIEVFIRRLFSNMFISNRAEYVAKRNISNSIVNSKKKTFDLKIKNKIVNFIKGSKSFW